MDKIILRIEEIVLSLDQKEFVLLDKIVNILSIPKNGIKFNIVKKSIDSRDKKKILFVYSVNVVVKDRNIYSRINKKHIKKHNIRFVEDYHYIIQKVDSSFIKNRPIVVGSGPSGLFSALILAKSGLNPIVIERGKDVDSRIKDVDKFFTKWELDQNSNIQFGEWWAGTFSDGKLYTWINDPRSKYVFEELIFAWAPKEISYDAKPHIWTDNLIWVVKNIRNKIISFWWEFRFQSCLTDIEIKKDKIISITLNGSEKIYTDDLILAIWHSARDTYQMLYDRGIKIQQKTFAIWLRIEHSKKLINQSQFGDEYNNSNLPTASYKLVSHHKNNRSVYTFCMCPWWYVIGASSEEWKLVVNGMSKYAQNSELSNSALLVSIDPSDFWSDHPLAWIEFQRKWEEAAFVAWWSNYNAPVQLVGDFLENKPSTKLLSFWPSYKPWYKLTSLDECLPKYVSSAIREAIPLLDKKLKWFAHPEAILTGIESRSSSPIRLVRDDNYQSNIAGIYPSWEGAWYAWGITSSAIDGLKVAEKIILKYKGE